MKICFVISRYPGGGVLAATLPLCDAAKAAGHEPMILFVRHKADADLPELGYSVASLGTSEETRAVPRKVWEWLEAVHPEVVVFSGATAAEHAIPHLSPSIRVIVAVHDAAQSYHRTVVEFEQDIDGIVAVSEYTAKQFRGRLRDPHRVQIIRNALPARKFEIPEVRQDDIYFTGGDSPLKGADDLLKLWPELLRQGFGGDLYWLGSMGKRMRRCVEKMPKSSRIQLLGHVPHSQIADMARHCRALLVLSRSETGPMIMFEAARCGCPSVGWDIDSGHVEHGRLLGCNYRAKFGDFKEMAAEIKRAIMECDSNADILAARAESLFNPDSRWQDYEQLCEKIRVTTSSNRKAAGTPPSEYRPKGGYYVRFLPATVRRVLTRTIFRSRKLALLLRNLRGS